MKMHQKMLAALVILHTFDEGVHKNKLPITVNEYFLLSFCLNIGLNSPD